MVEGLKGSYWLGLCLIAAALLVAGCCCCTDSGTDVVQNPGGRTLSSEERDLVGSWSSEGPTGTLFDPGTGFVTGSYYSAEGFQFRSDGTYRYLIVGSGTIISGIAVNDGKFRADGETLELYDIKESWYPNPAAQTTTSGHKNQPIADETLSYRFTDDVVLVVDEVSYFYRIEA